MNTTFGGRAYNVRTPLQGGAATRKGAVEGAALKTNSRRDFSRRACVPVRCTGSSQTLAAGSRGSAALSAPRRLAVGGRRRHGWLLLPTTQPVRGATRRGPALSFPNQPAAAD